MKKLFLLTAMLCSLSFGIRLGGFELTPELGAGVQKVDVNGESRYDWSAYGRVWVGVSNFVIAPQFKYTSIDDSTQKIKNTQIGLSAGYTLDLVLLYATPYIGASYSNFNKYYDDTLAYNAGLRVKPAILPFSVGVEYEYQKPNGYFGKATKMQAVRFNVGLSF